MSLGGSVRHAANLMLLLIFGIVVLGGMLIVAGMLGFWLLPLTFVFIFMLAVYFTGGQGMTGTMIIGGIMVLFLFGLGLKLVLGSVIGFDPFEQSYISTLASVKLATVGGTVSDGLFSQILGIMALVVILIITALGFLVQTRRRR